MREIFSFPIPSHWLVTSLLPPAAFIADFPLQLDFPWRQKMIRKGSFSKIPEPDIWFTWEHVGHSGMDQIVPHSCAWLSVEVLGSQARKALNIHCGQRSLQVQKREIGGPYSLTLRVRATYTLSSAHSGALYRLNVDVQGRSIRYQMWISPNILARLLAPWR